LEIESYGTCCFYVHLTPANITGHTGNSMSASSTLQPTSEAQVRGTHEQKTGTYCGGQQAGQLCFAIAKSGRPYDET
jgi:hypothetical protein